MQWYWIRHYVFDWFISVIIIKVFCFVFIVTGFLHTTASSVLHAFFSISQKKKREREREWMSKQYQKLRCKVKESFVKLVNFLWKSIYIYTLYHVAFGHFIPLTVLFSLQINKYYWFVFVRCCGLCLIFTIQHVLTIFCFLNLALNLSSFCSLRYSFTALPPHFRVKVPLFVKHNSSEISMNKTRFRKFCKRLSVYPWSIRCVQEK